MKIKLLLSLSLFSILMSFGQLSIPDATPVIQNFDGMSTSAAATLPTGFKVGTIADYTSGTTTTTIAAGTSGTGAITGTSSGGVYNFADGITASATDRSLGFLTTGSFSSPRTIMLAIKNDNSSVLTDLTINFDYEKYRTGTRALNMTFFHGSTATAIITAATTGDQSYGVDASNAVVNPPTTISKTVTLTGLTIAPGAIYYLCWTYAGVSGSSNAQGLGIDNLKITAGFSVGGGPVPVVTGSTTSGTVGTTFNYNIVATNSPTSYSLFSGALPAGLTLNTTSGLISGTPTASGSFTANFTATNANGTSTDVAINFNIALAPSACVSQGFGGGTSAPSGWSFTGISSTYTTAGNFGLASPSLSFDSTNDIIITEILPMGNAASQLSFWIKGQGINAGSKSTLVIDGFDGTSWTNIDVLTSAVLIASSSAAIIKTYDSGSTPALATGYVRFRFTYKKDFGNLAFDDVSVSCTAASQSTPSVISSSDVATVGGAYSFFVNATNFPTSYAIISGTLPPGLLFNTTTGQISGAATSSGTYNIDVNATNAAGTGASGTITIVVSNYIAGCYTVDFEDGTAKGSYASDDIALNGRLWDLSETISGGTSTAGDFGTSNLCLRMRSNANSAATLIQDKSYGIGTVKFAYKKFGSDSYTNQVFNVEYSKDSGNTWLIIGTVSPSTNTVQNFNATVNQAGPIRFRIVFASGNEGNSVRLNIDNLEICDYITTKEIEIYSNATTIGYNSVIVSENNNTYFSPSFFVGVDAPIIKTFTIFNYGTGVLNLSSLNLSTSSNFTITSGLSSTALTTGQSATFSITFNSLDTGVKTATVTINSNDPDESNFNFVISARALNYFKCTLLAPSIIAQQDFDSNTSYTYNANTNNANTAVGGGTAFGANRTSKVPMFIGTNSFQSKSNLNKITFAAQNTQNYQNIELNLNVGAFGSGSSVGMNTSDYLEVSISVDGGLKFYPQLKISGNNNSIFDINNTLPTNICKYKANATVATIFGCTGNSTNTTSGSYKITNLPNVADIRVMITFLSGASTKIWSVDNVTLKGQLPLTSTWDGSNWLPTAPNVSTKAIIAANYTTDLVNGSIDSCECQINNAITVNIENGYYLDCESNFTNNGILNVNNNGSFVQLNDDAVNSGLVNKITRTTSSFDKYDYTYWSSPIVGTTLNNTFSTWNTSFAFSFNTSNFQDIFSGLGFPQSIPGADTFDDNGDDWQVLNVNTPFQVAKGYAIMAPITGTFPRTDTVSFTGELNNGLKNYSLQLSQNTTNNNDDFNLVGNPYPSAISADNFIKTNITPISTTNKISGTIAFWTHKDNIQPYTTNAGPNFYNYNANDYALYNLSGPTATGAGSASGSGSTAPTGFIASGQAFFVEAENTNDLVFNNSMRSKTFGNSQFFRNSNPTVSNVATAEKDRIWLNLYNTDNMFSQQLIAYIPNTTLDFDYGYDAKYKPLNTYLSFYSAIDNDLESKYKIQSRSDFNEDDTIVIGYSSAVSGSTSIAIDRAEGTLDDASTNIYLQDNLLNITHDLKTGPYTFYTNYGTFDNRFVLKYKNNLLSNNDFKFDTNFVKIGSSNNQVNIFSSKENIKAVEVYDILGRKIFENKQVYKINYTINDLSATNQVLIVKVFLENGEVFSNKIIAK